MLLKVFWILFPPTSHTPSFLLSCTLFLHICIPSRVHTTLLSPSILSPFILPPIHYHTRSFLILFSFLLSHSFMPPSLLFSINPSSFRRRACQKHWRRGEERRWQDRRLGGPGAGTRLQVMIVLCVCVCVCVCACMCKRMCVCSSVRLVHTTVTLL